MSSRIYQFESFSQFKKITHGISTKEFGSIKNVESLQIDRDGLTKFAADLGITDAVVCMKQIHGGSVSIIENTNRLQISETDALITDKKHTPLAVLTADCLPILLYDPEKNVVGIAHAGYRGLLQHVIENTVKQLVTHFKSDPNDIIIGIGPSIERDCYEVGKELVQKFQEEFPSFDDIFAEKDGKYFLDLRKVAEQCLLKEGILKEHIEIMDVCTKCGPNFYSYRGGDGDKRFVSIISLIIP
ncbi:MAG TPA: peptidoglycan editing factor PgeF [Candidatus Acidoferrales bacterium]|nr:peptidoglycan editing factor PgeF [Candidatus Acidoferrales bacterium]